MCLRNQSIDDPSTVDFHFHATRFVFRHSDGDIQQEQRCLRMHTGVRLASLLKETAVEENRGFSCRHMSPAAPVTATVPAEKGERHCLAPNDGQERSGRGELPPRLKLISFHTAAGPRVCTAWG